MGIELPYRLPLAYSRERCREYEHVAEAVLDQVFEVYAQHLGGELTLEPSQWKLVKQRENIQIHYSRERFPPHALLRPLHVSVASHEVRAHAEWSPMVKLLVTGSMLGSLDDAMYGACIPTEAAMRMRSIVTQDDFYYHRTLRDIVIPTASEPFKYVGLKWSCRTSYVGSLIKARDMVYIEANGFRDVHHNGQKQRVGYTLYHSVELPDVPPLESQDVLRCMYSAIVLYRQTAPGVVEVFSTTSLAPNGDLLFKVTAYQAAEALIAVCKVTENAMKKRLMWMKAARSHAAPGEFQPGWQSRRLSFSHKLSTKTTCVQCARSLSAIRSLTSCEICATLVCSRCVTSQKLVLGGNGKEDLVYKSVEVCKGCIHTARTMDNAAALAVYEFSQPFDRVRAQFEDDKPKRLSPPQQAIAAVPTKLKAPVGELPRATLSSSEDVTSIRGDEDRVSDAGSTHSSKRFSDEANAQRLQLWQQINELCLQAEQTYRQAVRQTQAVIQEKQTKS